MLVLIDDQHQQRRIRAFPFPFSILRNPKYCENGCEMDTVKMDTDFICISGMACALYLWEYICKIGHSWLNFEEIPNSFGLTVFAKMFYP